MVLNLQELGSIYTSGSLIPSFHLAAAATHYSKCLRQISPTIKRLGIKMRIWIIETR